MNMYELRERMILVAVSIVMHQDYEIQKGDGVQQDVTQIAEALVDYVATGKVFANG